MVPGGGGFAEGQKPVTQVAVVLITSVIQVLKSCYKQSPHRHAFATHDIGVRTDGAPGGAAMVLAADVERDLAGRVGLRPLVEPRQLFLRDDERAVGLRIFHGNVPDL